MEIEKLFAYIKAECDNEDVTTGERLQYIKQAIEKEMCEVPSPEVELTAQHLKDASNVLKMLFPKRGFTLIVFDFGEGLRPFRYISNAKRNDMENTLESLLIKWKSEKN